MMTPVEMSRKHPAGSVLLIDGSQGEGGGQVLRTSLALSVITGRTFRITGIRARRSRPGLMRQHLACVHAAAAISRASVSGAELKSQELAFAPERAGAYAGEYEFVIGSAGSTSLLLQTVLLPLLLAQGSSNVMLEGGTHNPMAPTFDYLDQVFVPLLRRMGAQLEMELERPGFVPAGGGRVRVAIAGGKPLGELHLEERGATLETSATAVAAGGLSGDIARRELKKVSERFTIAESALQRRTWTNSAGPGNFVRIDIRSEHVAEQFTGIGQIGKRAEQVAGEAAQEAREYLAVGAPVGPHLADQLLLPMALGAGGSFVTGKPTLHTQTNIAVIGKFLDVRIKDTPLEDGARHRIEVRGLGAGRG